MGAIGNKVLKDLGYDPNYKIGYTGSVDRTNYKAQVAAPSAGGYIGNILSSIRSGVQALPGVVGGALKKSFYDEPAALGTFIGNRIGNAWSAPGSIKQAGENYKMVTKSALDNMRAGKLSTEDFLRITDNARKQYIRATGDANSAVTDFVKMPVDTEYYKKSIPVATTALTLATGSPAVGSIAKGAGSLAKTEGITSKVLGKAGNFADETFGIGKTLFKGESPISQIGNFAGKVARNELVAQPTTQSLMQAPTDINNIRQGKDIGSSAFNLAGIAAPSIITGGTKLLKAGGQVASKALFDTAGVFDHVKIKGGTVNNAFKVFKEQNSELAPRIVKATENKLRQIQDLALQEARGNAKLAASNLERYQSSMNKFGDLELPKFVDEFHDLLVSRVAAQNAGFDAVGRLSIVDKKIIKNRLLQAENMGKELKALQEEGLVKNRNLYGQLDDLIATGDKKYIRSGFKDIKASTPKLVDGKPVTFKNGYFAIKQADAGTVHAAQDTRKLIEGTKAPLAPVGNVLRKVGLSPEQVTSEDNLAVFNKVKTAFMDKVDGIGHKTGNQLYKELNKVAENSMGVTDIRQLSATKVAEGLNVTKSEAKQLIRAAKDSYKGLSLADRGMAGKLMDFNLRVNPLAAPYSKAQSVLRYEKNPFFRLQENIETRAGVAVMGGKQARPWGEGYDKTIQTLNKKGIFTSGYGAEGADSFSGSFNGVKAKLSRDQKANIAASIEKFAGGPNKVDDWLRNPKNADLLNDFKTIVQYPDKGFTSSNLAKMMNLVAFPSRYNLKVIGFAIKQFAKAPAPVQIATIRALGDFNEFAKSPEGIKWQADNKEAIGLFKYFTPIMPIASVYDTITGKNKTLGDIGLIGGLPFGLITRVLTGQGIIKDSTPYVDPRTGKVYSDRVPEDLKARAQSLLESVIDTLYTYPGRSAGMETSKKQLTSGLANNLSFGQLKDGKYSEVDRSADATPEQQRQIQILQSLSKPATQSIRSNGTPALTPIKAPATIKPAPIYKAKKAKKGKTKYIARPIASL